VNSGAIGAINVPSSKGSIRSPRVLLFGIFRPILAECVLTVTCAGLPFRAGKHELAASATAAIRWP
jgi:hypothetical protein